MPGKSLIARLQTHNGESSYWSPSKKRGTPSRVSSSSSTKKIRTNQKPPKKRMKHFVSKKKLNTSTTKSPSKISKKKTPTKKKTPIKKNKGTKRKKSNGSSLRSRIASHNKESSYWNVSGLSRKKRRPETFHSSK